MKASDNPCIACGVTPTDRAHIKTMKTGGTWDDFNIVALCRMHHQESHNLGWSRFIGKYKHTYTIFRSKGWNLQDVLGITKLVRYAKD